MAALIVLAVLVPAPAWAALDGDLADSLAGSLRDGNLWLALGAAWVGGVLTSLTPCVYPLIPVTIRYFGGLQQANRAQLRRLAMIYVLGMVLLYAVLGTVFASLKIVFGSFLANAWVVGGIALLCAAMGVSMLGAFTVQLPAGLNTRLSQIGGQSAGGAFGMGLVSGLIAAPCTGPVLAVILALIASTGELAVGFGLMSAFALGLGLPFLFLAMFSGALQRLPSSGVWMESIKGVLATAMFVVAVYFLQFAWPALPGWLSVPQRSAVSVALVGAGVLAGILYLVTATGLRAVLKVASVAALTLGISIAMVGKSGAGDTSGAPPIEWLTSHERAVSTARFKHMPMMIDFTADWCAACKELDLHTYSDPRVRQAAQRFVNLKVDATEMSPAVDALFAQYGVLGLPTVAFVDSQGSLLKEPRITGFVPPERMLEVLERVP